jgi:hypothetical protein
MKIETKYSSETFDFQLATRRYIPEDSALHKQVVMKFPIAMEHKGLTSCSQNSVIEPSSEIVQMFLSYSYKNNFSFSSILFLFIPCGLFHRQFSTKLSRRFQCGDCGIGKCSNFLFLPPQ